MEKKEHHHAHSRGHEPEPPPPEPVPAPPPPEKKPDPEKPNPKPTVEDKKPPGVRVHDISDSSLKYLTADKSLALAVDGSEDDLVNDPETAAKTINKARVQLRLPSVGANVAQRQVTISTASPDQDDKDKEKKKPVESKFALTPDTSYLDLIVPLDSLVHVEVVHVDGDGAVVPNGTYSLNFSTVIGMSGAGADASPIGVIVQGSVSTIDSGSSSGHDHRAKKTNKK